MGARKESAEPYKEFIREMTLRIERALQAFGEQMRQDRQESRREFAAMQAKLDLQLEETRELREESRAQTRALLRVIDRLDNGGPAAAT